MHLTPNFFFTLSSLSVLNSEIFLVFNFVLLSYIDWNLRNANKMTLIQDFAIISTSICNMKFTA